MTQIIKRRGHKQKFDERKLYASIYAGCLSANIEKEEAAATSNLVVRELNRWLDEKKEITSNQIFSKVGEELGHLNKEASFMYTTHRDIS